LTLDLLSREEHTHHPKRKLADCRVAVYTDNGFVRCTNRIKDAVQQCAEFLSRCGMIVEEQRPPGVDQAYDLEMGLLGADGGEGIEAYLRTNGTAEPHPLLAAWLDRLRLLRAASQEQYRRRFADWDRYRAAMADFFTNYEVVLCPVYTQVALAHGDSVKPGNFEGFSYTMAWNVAGTPAAVVRCGIAEGLPINVQIVTGPGQDHLALEVCRLIEQEFGGWHAPPI
jgi:amidase